jgi:hypothetical protein
LKMMQRHISEFIQTPVRQLPPALLRAYPKLLSLEIKAPQ